MKYLRLTRLRLIHTQLQLRSEKQNLSRKVEAHILVTNTLKGAIAAGENERVELEESLERLRLSKVIEALRRVNLKDDFNEVLEDLVSRLRKISEIATSLDGITMRNMLPPATMQLLVEELREMHDVWQRFDEAEIHLSTVYQEMKQVRERMRDVDEKLRSLMIQQKIADAL